MSCRNKCENAPFRGKKKLKKQRCMKNTNIPNNNVFYAGAKLKGE